jgi:hypothetical protein
MASTHPVDLLMLDVALSVVMLVARMFEVKMLEALNAAEAKPTNTVAKVVEGALASNATLATGPTATVLIVAMGQATKTKAITKPTTKAIIAATTSTLNTIAVTVPGNNINSISNNSNNRPGILL